MADKYGEMIPGTENVDFEVKHTVTYDLLGPTLCILVYLGYAGFLVLARFLLGFYMPNVLIY